MKPWRRGRQLDGRTRPGSAGRPRGFGWVGATAVNPQARPWRRLVRRRVPPGFRRAVMPERLPTARDGVSGWISDPPAACRVTPPGPARALAGCRFGSAVNPSRSSAYRQGPGQHGQATCSQRPLGPDCTPVHHVRVWRTGRDRVRPLAACKDDGRPATGQCPVRRRPRHARPQTVAGACCGRDRAAIRRRWTCRYVAVRRAHLWLAR